MSKVPEELNANNRFLEAGARVGLVACWLVPLFFYFHLPLVIPIHFDAFGHPNGYSSRAGIWGLPVIVTFVYIILTVVNKMTVNNSSVNLPVAIPGVSLLTKRLLLLLKAEIALLLALTGYFMLLVASGKLTQMPGFMLPLVLIVIFGTVARFLWQVWHLQKIRN